MSNYEGFYQCLKCLKHIDEFIDFVLYFSEITIRKWIYSLNIQRVKMRIVFGDFSRPTRNKTKENAKNVRVLSKLKVNPLADCTIICD